jgi:glycerol-3-phosphate O-acyltransferase
MKYLVRAWLGGGREDVVLVPIGISYERIAEENALAAEQKGGEKKSESLLQLLRLSSIRRRRFGSVMLNVGEPLSLKEFYQEREQLKEIAVGDAELPRFTEDIGFAVSRRIRDCTAITGTALTAAALDTMYGERLAEAEVVSRMQNLLRVYAVHRGWKAAKEWRGEAKVGGDGEERESMLRELLFGGILEKALLERSFADAMKEVLHSFCGAGYAKCEEGTEGSVIYLREAERLKISYYKSNILHYFVEPAVLLQCCGVFDQPLSDRLHLFHQLFKPVFLLPFWRDWKRQLQVSIERFSAVGWLSSEKAIEGAEESCLGLASLDVSTEGIVVLKDTAALLRPLLEALYAAAESALALGWEEVSEEDFLLGLSRMVLEGVHVVREPHPEASAQSSLSFAMAAMCDNGFLSMNRGDEAGTGGEFVLKLEAGSFERLNAARDFLQGQLESICRLERNTELMKTKRDE